MSMTSKEHREWVESIICNLAEENPSITFKTNTVKLTPVYLDGERVMDVYYRKESIRIYVKYGSKQYQIYELELPEFIAYQKETADPKSTKGVYGFFVNDKNIEFVFRKLLMNQ